MRARRLWLVAFFKRVIRTARALALEPRVPRWTRVLFVLGCLPIPFCPIDEVFLVLAVLVLAVRHRPLLREHWELTGAGIVIV